MPELGQPGGQRKGGTQEDHAALFRVWHTSHGYTIEARSTDACDGRNADRVSPTGRPVTNGRHESIANPCRARLDRGGAGVRESQAASGARTWGTRNLRSRSSAPG